MRATRREKELLHWLVAFANGGEERLQPRHYVNLGNIPTFTLVAQWSESDWQTVRQVAIKLLSLISPDNTDGVGVLEAYVNHRGLSLTLLSRQGKPAGRTVRGTGGTQRILRGDPGGPAFMVPTPSRAEDLPYAIMALARCTPTGQGDSLADRISQCDECERFFLLPTRKCSRFCGPTCRHRATNQARVAAGVFQGRYRRRLVAQEPRPRKGEKKQVTRRATRTRTKRPAD